MGGHGGLNITGEKSWNPGGAAQRARVAADEARAAEAAAGARAARARAAGERAREGLAAAGSGAGAGPVAARRRELLFLLEGHATVVVVGPAGCGKTTRIPPLLRASGWCAGGRAVVCTQPRRVAAVAAAHRVAEEVGCAVGAEVGYSVRFERREEPGRTVIRYCTDGVLLREMLEDPLLSRFSVVMVDEAHERSIATDLLLGLLRKVQRRRPDLRVLISSATLDAEVFVRFFDLSRAGLRAGLGEGQVCEPVPSSLKPAVLSLEGTVYAVDVFYAREPAVDYVKAAVETVREIHKAEGPGDVLAFLTSESEVLEAVGQLREVLGGALVLPLFAELPRESQANALRPSRRGVRKVVVATNVAETSLTIEGVVFVVDSCFVKRKRYCPLRGIESLRVEPESKASAAQRAGRAGRLRPGKCFRLCTEAAFHRELLDTEVPQIEQSDLCATVLQLKAMGVDNVVGFDWIAPPSPEAMVHALDLLYAMGALGDDAKLTSPLGVRLAELPLHPTVGKALLASADLGCSEELLSIAAMLTPKSIWSAGRGRAKALAAAKAMFAVGEGDLVTSLNVYLGYEESNQSLEWCHEHCLNPNALRAAWRSRGQLGRALDALKIEKISGGTDTESVRKALAHGFFTNAASLGRAGDGGAPYETIQGGLPVSVHASSVLHGSSPPTVIFTAAEQSSSDSYEIRGVTPIEATWLPDIAPQLYHTRGPAGPPRIARPA